MPLAVLILLIAAGLALVMALAWVMQRQTANAGWVDVFWTVGAGLAGLAFALVPVGETLFTPTARQVAIAALCAIWSARLALHLAKRVARGAEDPRYHNIRERWGAGFEGRFFWFLQLQALCAFLLAIAILCAARNPAAGIGPLDVAAVVVLIIAIGGEAMADRQLRRFKDDPANRARICDVGLWAWSRHPNYFFEWLGWVAYPLFAMDLGGGYSWGWVAFLGPAFMYVLLVYGSGIPPLEAHMLRTRGAAFRDYQSRTNAFFPAPPRLRQIESGR